MTFLHEHRRRVPTQDYLGRIDVRVVSMAAGGADEDRLILATPSVHRATRKACTRGIVGGHFRERPAPFFQLVGEQGFEEMPALVQDRPVLPGFLPDIPPRRGQCATGGAGHVPGVQVFDHHRAEAPRQVKAGPVVPVAPDTRAAGRQGSHTPSCLGVAPRSAFAPGQHPLRLALSAVQIGKGGRYRDMLARGQRQRVGHAPVDAHGRRDIRRGLVLNREAERDMPAIRRKADRGVVDPAAQRAAIAETHPSDFGQAHFRPVAVQPAGRNLAALKSERIVFTLLSRRRVAGSAVEPVAVCPVEIAQSLLLWRDMDRRDPIVFAAQFRQFAGLTRITDAVAGGAAIGAVMVAPLFKGKIVDQAAHPRELREQACLRGRRFQLVDIAARYHASILVLFSQQIKANLQLRAIFCRSRVPPLPQGRGIPRGVR